MTGFQSDSSRQGRAYESIVAEVIQARGMDIIQHRWRHPEVGVEIDYLAACPGDEYVHWIEAKGSWLGLRPGLIRTDSTKKLVANAWHLTLASDRGSAHYVAVTSNAPVPGSYGHQLLSAAMDHGLVDEVWLIVPAWEMWKP